MHVRRGQPEESRVVARLWLRSRAAAVPAIPAQVHTDEEVCACFEHVVLPEREVWVAENDIGFVGILVLDDDWIDQLYVEPDHTGQGIAGQLMGVAKRERSSGLRLWTFEANVRGRRFYRRHGFVEMGATNGDNEERAPDVRYEWSPRADAP